MSSSCPERLAPWRRRAGAVHVPAVLALMAGAPVDAAQMYFQPFGELSVDVDSNRDLARTGPKPVSEGYVVDLGGIWNLNTPQSNTIIKPHFGYQWYPRIRENALLTIIDLYSQNRFERGELDVSGQFDRRATYNSELADAAFNPVNPNLPTAPETGRVNVSSTRTLGTLAPAYKYELTQRLTWGVSGVYQNVDYGGSNAGSYVPFDYYLGATTLGWVATRRLDTTFSVYGSRESAKDGSGSVNAGGAKVGFDFRWSQLFTTHLELFAEHDDSKTVKPIVSNETSTGGGGTFSLAWKGEISRVLLSIGRTLTPSGAGGKYAADQVQVEYHRDLSPRLTLNAAAIYNKYTALSTVDRGNNYDYANVRASMRWMLTRTWYFQGGLAHLTNRFPAPSGRANNEVIYISFGYEGLRRPQ